jgi:hypothetical protein
MDHLEGVSPRMTRMRADKRRSLRFFPIRVYPRLSAVKFSSLGCGRSQRWVIDGIRGWNFVFCISAQ